MATVTNFDELAVAMGNDIDCTPYQVGRSLYKYTDCGPWTSFILNKPWAPSDGQKTWDGMKLYYEDEAAAGRDFVKNIIGVKFGSIVEGSDVEISPVELMFPFESERIDEVIKGMDEEASFYWERDNKDWFYLKSPKGTHYAFHAGWGEVTWDSKKPIKAVVEAISAWTEEYYPGIWKKEDNNSYSMEAGYDKYVPFPGRKGWEVSQWQNDMDY